MDLVDEQNDFRHVRDVLLVLRWSSISYNFEHLVDSNMNCFLSIRVMTIQVMIILIKHTA